MENIRDPQNNNIENKELFFAQYKEKLLQLDGLLEKIRLLRWQEPTQYNSSLKQLFFRYLDGGDDDKLKKHITEIGQLNSLDELFTSEAKDHFGNLYKNKFRTLFSEVFRLFAFTKVEYYREELEKINFPFEEFENTLESLKKTLKDGCDLELIVPRLWIDKAKEKPELYQSEMGSSHIQFSQPVPREFEKDKEHGVIYDFETIGFNSNRLNIKEKAIVYPF